MTALPPSSDITGTTVTQGGLKIALNGVRDYLSGLFGSDGTPATARTALGLGNSAVRNTGTTAGTVALCDSVLLNKTSEKTSAYTVLATDRGTAFFCSGTFTLSLTAAATLADGFAFAVRNTGSGVITIDPNASEQIDGATSITIAAGESCLVACNGAGFYTIGKTASTDWPTRVRTLTSGITYTPPADVKKIRVFVTGATGGISTGTYRGGVGGGGYSEKLYNPVGASYTYAIGAGGTTSGTAGGTTTFDVMSVTGSGGVTSATGSSGGVGSGGDFNASGGTGGNSVNGNNGGGGGGGAGSRAGNGGTGGNGSNDGGTGGGGGGGGGTGLNNGVAGSGAIGGAGGVAASSVAAAVIAAFDDIPGFVFDSGSQGGSSTSQKPNGGRGAGSIEVAGGIANGNATGAGLGSGSGSGGIGGVSSSAVGNNGGIVIWEYL